MKTIGQVIDEIDLRVEHYTERALNPDRVPFVRDNELHRRQELVKLREFICGDGTEE